MCSSSPRSLYWSCPKRKSRPDKARTQQPENDRRSVVFCGYSQRKKRSPDDLLARFRRVIAEDATQHEQDDQRKGEGEHNRERLSQEKFQLQPRQPGHGPHRCCSLLVMLRNASSKVARLTWRSMGHQC